MPDATSQISLHIPRSLRIAVEHAAADRQVSRTRIWVEAMRMYLAYRSTTESDRVNGTEEDGRG